MAKRLVHIYITDEGLELIDKLKDDANIKKELNKEKLSRADVIEFTAKFYWKSRTLGGMLEI